MKKKPKILKKLRPKKIIVGAGGTTQKGWKSTEKKFLDLLKRENWENNFEQGSLKAILAEHVWEHLTKVEGKVAAKNCYDFLRKGGYLRVAVPDGFHPSPEYIKWVMPQGVGSGADNHKVLYNFKSLSSLFRSVGFKVKLLEYFDEKGRFHSKHWKVEDGFIKRSSRFDKRNINSPLKYTSLILDAIK